MVSRTNSKVSDCSSRAKAQHLLKLAEMKGAHLRRELELERKLMEAEESILVAKANLLDIDDDEAHSDVEIDVGSDAQGERLQFDKFLTDCKIRIGQRDCEPGMPSSHQCSNHATPRSSDLPKFELSVFSGNPQIIGHLFASSKAMWNRGPQIQVTD